MQQDLKFNFIGFQQWFCLSNIKPIKYVTQYFLSSGISLKKKTKIFPERNGRKKWVYISYVKKNIFPQNVSLYKEGFGLKAIFILSSALRGKFLSQLSCEETNVTKSIMEIILIIILITFSKNLRILFKYNLLQML